MTNENDTPLISVIMLSYNHEEFIEDAIKSVFFQKVDYPHLELIIIDDGSTDHTLEILDRLQKNSPISMRVIKKDHKGVEAIASNLNELFSLTKGSYVALLASDDEFIANRFKKQLSILQNNEKIQFVYANGINIREKNLIGNVNSKSIVQFLSQNNVAEIYNYITNSTSPLYLQSILIKKKFLDSFTPFDEELIGDDWVFNIRAFKILLEKNLECYYVNENVFYRHLHTTNTSSNLDVHLKRIVQVIDKYTPIQNQRKFYQKIYWRFSKEYLRKFKIFKALKLCIKILILPALPLSAYADL